MVHPKKRLYYIPSGYSTVRHGIDGPNRNRWFTVLNSMVIFHGYVSHNQRVIIVDLYVFFFLNHTIIV